MAPVRACFLISDDYGGGIRTVTTGLVNEIHAVAPGQVSVSLLVLKASCGWLNPALYAFPITFLNSPASSHDIHLLLDWLRRNRPDVLILNGCLSVDPYIELLARFTRVIYVSHDYTHAALNPALQQFSSLHAHISVSKVVSSVFEQHLPLALKSSQKLVVIPNGIQAAPQLSPPRDATSIRIVYLGGDEQRKGFRVVAKTLKSLAQLTSRPVHVTFAGRYKTPIPDFPHSSITTVCRPDLSPAEVAQLLGESHVLLAPSYRESFGMVVLEAAAHGCVPITWRLPTGPCQLVGSIPVLRRHCLVEPFSYRSFARAILAICDQHATFAGPLSALCAEYSASASAWHYVHLLTELARLPLLSYETPRSVDYLRISPGDPAIHLSPVKPSALFRLPAAMLVRRLCTWLKKLLISLFHLLLRLLEDVSPFLYYRAHLMAYCRLVIFTPLAGNCELRRPGESDSLA